MKADNNSGKERQALSPIFINCQNAFVLINEGKEKQAAEMFPMEYYLIQKYSFDDFNELMELLEKKLIIED